MRRAQAPCQKTVCPRLTLPGQATRPASWDVLPRALGQVVPIRGQAIWQGWLRMPALTPGHAATQGHGPPREDGSGAESPERLPLSWATERAAPRCSFVRHPAQESTSFHTETRPAASRRVGASSPAPGHRSAIHPVPSSGPVLALMLLPVSTGIWAVSPPTLLGGARLWGPPPSPPGALDRPQCAPGAAVPGQRAGTRRRKASAPAGRHRWRRAAPPRHADAVSSG